MGIFFFGNDCPLDFSIPYCFSLLKNSRLCHGLRMSEVSSSHTIFYFTEIVESYAKIVVKNRISAKWKFPLDFSSLHMKTITGPVKKTGHTGKN
jgi:hypothetical protein